MVLCVRVSLSLVSVTVLCVYVGSLDRLNRLQVSIIEHDTSKTSERHDQLCTDHALHRLQGVE